MVFAMDLTPLIEDPDKGVQAYVQEFTERFVQEVEERLTRLQAPLLRHRRRLYESEIRNL
jgi:hypothetical protein